MTPLRAFLATVALVVAVLGGLTGAALWGEVQACRERPVVAWR